MNIYEIFKNHWQEGLFGIIVVSGIVQISPIKINPWSWLYKNFIKLRNSELLEKYDILLKKIEQISERLEQHIADEEEEAATTKRNRIIRFSNDVQRIISEGGKLDQKAFESIIVDIDSYDSYCDSHPGYRNSMAEPHSKFLKETYYQCLLNGTFKEQP